MIGKMCKNNGVVATRKVLRVAGKERIPGKTMVHVRSTPETCFFAILCQYRTETCCFTVHGGTQVLHCITEENRNNESGM